MKKKNYNNNLYKFVNLQKKIYRLNLMGTVNFVKRKL